MGRSQTEISQETLNLSYTLDQIDATGIYRTFYSTADYIFFLSTDGTFSRIVLCWAIEQLY
jgi:hypothetical protein